MVNHISLDRLVPEDDFYRRLNELLELSYLYQLCSPFYGTTGNPSIDPVVPTFVGIKFVGYLENITSSPDSVGTKKGAMAAGLYYEANVAVDPAHRVVTNVALTKGAQEDVDMLLPLLDGTLEKYEKLGLSPDSIGTVDANYASGRNLMEVARRGLQYYGPHKVEYDKKVYPLSRFEYNPEGDYYTCPHCKRLNFRSTTRHLGKGQRVYQARASDCPGCPAKEKCTAAKRRQLFVSQYQPYEELLSQRMKRPRAKRYMRRRRAGAEGVFGECKEHHCLRHTRYRGHPKVYKEVLMIFATYNLKRLFRFIKERSCPAWAQGHKLLARLQYLYAFFKHCSRQSSLVTAYE